MSQLFTCSTTAQYKLLSDNDDDDVGIFIVNASPICHSMYQAVPVHASIGWQRFEDASNK